jgi:hypothetical protein
MASHPNDNAVTVANILSFRATYRQTLAISRQTEVHSFGDHLISGSVSVTPSSVT